MTVTDAPLVEKVTPEQELQLERYFLDWYWLAHEEPVDKPAVSAAVGRLYRALKLDAPPIVFCESPWQLVAVRGLLRLLATTDGVSLREVFAESLKMPLWSRAEQTIQAHWNLLAPLLTARESGGAESSSTFLTKDLFNDFTGPLQSVLRETISQADKALDLQLGLRAKLQLRQFGQSRRQARRPEILRGNLFGGAGGLPPTLEQFLGGNRALDVQGLDRPRIQNFTAELLEQLSEQNRKRVESAAAMVQESETSVLSVLPAISQRKPHSPVETLFQVSQVSQVSLEYISLLGQLDNLPTYGFALSKLPLEPDPTIRNELEAWLIIKKHAFHLCCYDKLSLLCQYPTIAKFNESRRLHSTEGPALEFRDGFKVYAINGVILPSDIIENSDSITVQRIDAETNVEIRRILINLYGLEKYLKDSQAEEIDADDGGILYKKHVPNDEPIVVVKVRNSSPDPDGTFKDYFLRVPPNITTVRAAVAWTFDMNSEDYSPTSES